MRFCNISAYCSPVTVAVTKPESRISSKKKGSITVDVVNPTHTVTFSPCNGVSTTVLGFSVAQILAVLGVDRPSEREVSFVGPQQVTQPIVIFRHLLKRPHRKCPPIHLIASDKAHFWLNGYVNKQNCRIWSEANPQVYVETPLHPEKLTVWCALWAGGILLQKR
ncbi:hypothetical protein TNCV_3074341 [Trichonephila clavipes]|uniref:Uncharacterized protein n=1 Tax=Trichonephila clavipes TaxID=2585209 RepID=A0A8X6VHG3_TRICX|nr:hypothetical protein TNCV_3074341 [Trichonephila clavipes]